MATYSYPSARAASAISSSVARPSVAVVCMCRSPRISRCSTSFGRRALRPVRSRPGFRAARAESSRAPAPGRRLLRFRPPRACRRRARNSPYSLSLRPMRMARCRSATLCSLLPVKYCMAAPKLSCSSARTSTCRPSRPSLHAGFVGAAPEHFVDARMRRHAFERRGRIRAGDEKVHDRRWFPCRAADCRRA